MEVIKSPQNKVVKHIMSLSNKKGRDAEGLFIVEGIRLVMEITRGFDVVLYGFREDAANGELWEKVSANNKCYVFDKRIFNMLCDTQTPQGVFAVCRQKKCSIEEVLNIENGFFVIAQKLSDPGNLGTIIRTADAANVSAILLTSESVDLYNPKVIRSTMGSVFHLPIVENVDLDEIVLLLKKKNVLLLAAHLKGDVTPYDVDMRGSVAILIGNEAHGLTDSAAALCDKLVKIPMPGQAESLNASIAAGLLIYEGVRQRYKEV